MRYAVLAGVVATALAATLAGALVGYSGAGDTRPAAHHADGREVVTAAGLPEIEIGTSRGDLIRTQGMAQGPGDCAPRLPDRPAASPVFDDDELVLLWADPPLRTADGVTVGSPVAEVTGHYPDAEPLTAPAGTYRFDGLLVTVDGLAYLFLHDDDQVQKLIVGSEEHARLLFEEGFGTC